METFDRMLQDLVDGMGMEAAVGAEAEAEAEKNFQEVFKDVIEKVDISFGLSVLGQQQEMKGRCTLCLHEKRPVKRNGKLWIVSVWMQDVELRDRTNGVVIANKPEHLFAEQRSCCGGCSKRFVEEEIKPLFVTHFGMDEKKFDVSHPDWDS